MAKEKKQRSMRWLKRVLIPFWVVQCLFMVILVGAMAYLTALYVTATSIVVILISSGCLIATLVEMVLWGKKCLSAVIYLILQVVKTTIWLIVFLISIIDRSIIAYNGGDAVVVSSNTGSQVVGSTNDVASRDGLTALLDGTVEASIILASFLGSLIYASVMYHRHRKLRKQLKDLNPHLRSDWPYIIGGSTHAALTSAQRVPPSMTDRADSTYYHHGPFAERGIPSSNYPRNAWQQASSPVDGDSNTTPCARPTHNELNAGVNHEEADNDTISPVEEPLSPTSTTANTHFTHTTRSTMTTINGRPPSYKTVDNRGRTIPSMYHSTTAAGRHPMHQYLTLTKSSAPPSNALGLHPAIANEKDPSRLESQPHAQVPRVPEIPTESEIYELSAQKSIKSLGSSRSIGGRSWSTAATERASNHSRSAGRRARDRNGRRQSGGNASVVDTDAASSWSRATSKTVKVVMSPSLRRGVGNGSTATSSGSGNGERPGRNER